MVASSFYNLLMIHKLLITSLLASTLASASCPMAQGKPNPALLEAQSKLVDIGLTNNPSSYKKLRLSKEQFARFCLDYIVWRDEQPGKHTEWSKNNTRWKLTMGKVTPEAKQAWGDNWLKRNPTVKKVSAKQLFDAFEKTFPESAKYLQ